VASDAITRRPGPKGPGPKIDDAVRDPEEPGIGVPAIAGVGDWGSDCAARSMASMR